MVHFISQNSPNNKQIKQILFPNLFFSDIKIFYYYPNRH